MTIKAIDSRVVELIASGQVITDLASAVKELIENSLDAGASSIEVVFHGEGLDAFEVIDNGNGMTEEDLRVLGQPHCTSKLSSFEGIDDLESLGFRGEAFHSLSTLSQSVSVTSRAPTMDHGLACEYGPGSALRSLKPCAGSQGTRIRVTGLFFEYAVRLLEWKKNAKKVLSKALRMVQSYAVGFPAVKFRCLSSEGGRMQTLSVSSGSGTAACALSEVFGVSSKHVSAVSLSVPGATVEGIVGRPDAPRRSSPDRQFFFVNGHPSDQKAIQKACNEAYREFGIADYPVVVMAIRLSAGECDVNLTPDKRSIVVFQEKELAAALRELITKTVFERIDLVSKVEGYSQTFLTPLVRAGDSSPTVSKVPLRSESASEASLLSESTQNLPEAFLSSGSPSVGPEEGSSATGCSGACSVDVSAAATALVEPATDSLCREDFLDMLVVGQFNCGFILTRLDRGDASFMYIVDQHAADERFRLETLERIEKAHVQQLVAPKRFQTSAEDTIFIESHLAQFKEIGFSLNVVSGGMFELTSVPQMANVTLDLPDFLDMIHDWSGSAIALARCSRVSAALASMACRSAVMIGAPLSFPQMSTVVKNLAGLEKPWICAHGRPTVRLLYSNRNNNSDS